MKIFTYAPPDTPQSKYYVYLYQIVEGFSCSYYTFWKSDSNQPFYAFPEHWCEGVTCHIGHFIQSNYTMIHSKFSLLEDHWYSNETCQTDDKNIYPCQEIHFLKCTNISLRYYQVKTYSETVAIRKNITFTVLSIGKSIDKYLKNIPERWPQQCKNDELNL